MSKLPVHSTPFLYKSGGKNIRFCAFCAFTLLRFCETHCWILQRFQKPPFLCVHIDQKRFQKPQFCGYPLLIAFLKTSVLWCFCADQCEHFHKNGGFSLRFCTKTEQGEGGFRGWLMELCRLSLCHFVNAL